MSAPRSVLMTADAGSGVLHYALELSRALGRRDVQVTLAVMGGPLSAAQREAAARVRGLALHESGYRLEWMDDPWDDVAKAGEWLLEIEDRVRPDVVHLDGYAHGALPFRAPKLVVAHGCVSSWFEAVEGRAAPPRFDRYRREVAAGLAGAAAVAAPTRAMMAALARHHGMPARAVVIPHGRDAERFRPRVKEDVVLSVGRVWDPAKNIAALSGVARALPWPVRVAGSDVALDGVRRPLADVDHLGVLDEDGIAAALSRASIFALPARHEPCGLSILEAALSGAALVLGDIPSLREQWGGAAIFVDPGDPEDLGRTLSGLIGNPGVRASLAERARHRARLASPEAMAVAYLRLYAEITARPGRATPPMRPPSVAPPPLQAARS
jgi:glycosyltransferase involved in cell wall biosynthesis